MTSLTGSVLLPHVREEFADVGSGTSRIGRRLPRFGIRFTSVGRDSAGIGYHLAQIGLGATRIRHELAHIGARGPFVRSRVARVGIGFASIRNCRARVVGKRALPESAARLYRDVLAWSEQPRSHGPRESLFVVLVEDPGAEAAAAVAGLGESRELSAAAAPPA